MTVLLALLATAIHAALMLAAAPLLVGAVRTAQARLLGRAGPPPLLPYRELRRLLRKQPVVPESASRLFRAAPAASFAVTAAAAMLVPSFARGMTTAPTADLVVLVGLLATEQAIFALAGMDAGTAFGGLGASRRASLAALAEPAMILSVLTMSLLAGSTNLEAIVAMLRDGAGVLPACLALVLLALATVAFTDDGQPAMEAIAREYSGVHLALLQGAGALKQLLWITLIAALLPFGMGDAGSPATWIAGAALWAAKITILAAALAAFEVSHARMRAYRAAECVGVAALIGLLAAVFLLISQGLA
ncbi:MAG: NADH-quinone oxidoreductase subunit H [Acidisphaera sp.]|nr:NADH-quinone oxidoreductase subunit H [Acidisphaera sp.]